MTVLNKYKVTEANTNTVHYFQSEADAIDSLSTEIYKTASKEWVQFSVLEEVVITDSLLKRYNRTNWQKILDDLDAEGISHDLLTSTNVQISILAWNLYNVLLKLAEKIKDEISRTKTIRTVNYLLSRLLIEVLSPTDVVSTLDLLARNKFILLEYDILKSALVSLGKLPIDYKYPYAL